MKLFIKLLPDQSPGNSVVLTTAIRDLKRANPDWKLNVGGGVVRDFFQNNPNIDSSVTEKTADKIVTAEYPFRGSMTKHYPRTILGFEFRISHQYFCKILGR